MAEIVGYTFVNGKLVVFVVGELDSGEREEIERKFGVSDFDVIKLKSGFKALVGEAR